LGTVENAGKLLSVENKISGHLNIKITLYHWNSK
jgi:hypothetical protein